MKPGEKLYEELFTDISERTYRYKDMYVILPDSINHISDKYQELMGNGVRSTYGQSCDLIQNLLKVRISNLVDPLMNGAENQRIAVYLKAESVGGLIQQSIDLKKKT